MDLGVSHPRPPHGVGRLEPVLLPWQRCSAWTLGGLPWSGPRPPPLVWGSERCVPVLGVGQGAEGQGVSAVKSSVHRPQTFAVIRRCCPVTLSGLPDEAGRGCL